MTVTTTLDDAHGLSSDSLAARALYRHALEAAVWGMPLVSVDAIRRALFRDAGARYCDFVFLSRAADARFQLPGANASALPVLSCFNTRAGPLVLDVPPSDGTRLVGSLLDAWQAPIADVGPEGRDGGRGGSYLLIPPWYDRRVPAGYIPVRAETHNGYLALRVIPASGAERDRVAAVALLERLRWSTILPPSHPVEPRHLDVAGRQLDGIVRFDDGFFDRLASILAEESLPPRDLMATAHLRALGITRETPFAPDDATREILRVAAEEAHATFAQCVGCGQSIFGASSWTMHPTVAARTSFCFHDDDDYFVDERGAASFRCFAPTRRPGAASLHLTSVADAHGDPLRGERAYRIRVPARVPARQFWSVAAYDSATAGFIRDAVRVGVDSFGALARNRDGSTNVYFGPRPPAGLEANWIATAPGRGWFATFRLYGPGRAVFDRSWALPDIEPV